MNFKIVISDPKTRKAYQVEKEQNQTGFIGKKIGEKISGDGIGLQGYEIEVTGGSDQQGFPMRRDVDGTGRKRILISMPPGFHPKIKGQRKRKSIRGNILSSDIMQVNVKVVKHGSKKIEELLGVKEAKKKEEDAEKEAKAEAEKKEKPKQEAPSEEKKEEAKPVKEEKKEQKDTEKKEEAKSEKAEEKMSIKKLEDAEKKEEKK